MFQFYSQNLLLLSYAYFDEILSNIQTENIKEVSFADCIMYIFSDMNVCTENVILIFLRIRPEI